MIKTNIKIPTDTILWSTVKHPVLVQTTDGSVFLTVEPSTERERKCTADFERDAICVWARTADWKYGQTVSKLNLELCSLFTGSITISNN
jgi:hypothetical protein